ncbi:MAG: protease modulator HflC [Bacteriovoracaceae bacterium]|nr:protease modulator HflC [Bacteriovoracaceae bacterium]
MKQKSFIVIVIVGVAALVTLKSSLYILTEGRQAVITQFGRPVGRPITKAGLHFKTPFIQEVRKIDKRILSWDGDPKEIPTKDKKYIKVDTTARWRIIDALKFIQTTQNERRAQNRLNAIIEEATRNEISNHNLVEAVRNTNSIIEKVNARKLQVQQMKDKGERFVDEDVSGEIETIVVGREELSRKIVEYADAGLTKYGIKLIDVQIRRISYKETVERKVYERMISERQKIAQKIRSIGQGEKAKIEGRLTKDLKEIESKAYRVAQTIRGKAEGEAIAIYARSFSKNPKFFEFQRSMQAYKKSFSKQVKFIFSANSEYLKYLKQGQ